MTTASTTGPQTDTPQDVEERVLKVIALTKRLPRESVTPESSFEALGIDSLDRLNILFDLESEFDIEINDEDAKRVENIPQMVAGVLVLVEAKNSGGAASAAAPTTTAGQPPPSITSRSQDASSVKNQSSTKLASSGE